MSRWRKGTRTMHIRTLVRSGTVPGQPYAPVTDPHRIEHADVPQHVCGECFGPRRHSNLGRLFCEQCMIRLFGGRWFYDSFIRSERARTTRRLTRLRARGVIS